MNTHQNQQIRRLEHLADATGGPDGYDLMAAGLDIIDVAVSTWHVRSALIAFAARYRDLDEQDQELSDAAVAEYAGLIAQRTTLTARAGEVIDRWLTLTYPSPTGDTP